MKATAIIVAGGSGKRMGGAGRKQYLMLGGRSILDRTLTPFLESDRISKIILVVPEEDILFCKETLLPGRTSQKNIVLIKGGKERQDSVYNGLAAVDDVGGVVLIHDGVRPFVTVGLIENLADEAEKNGACIPGISAFDTLKRVSGSGIIEETVNRQGIFLAQTPQAFKYSVIRKAHDDAKKHGFPGTDDASLVERLGYQVKVLNGSRNNIKITTREDLILGEAIINSLKIK